MSQQPVIAIFDKLIAALKTIKPPTYLNTVKTVYEIALLPDQLADSNMPALFTLETEEGETFEWDDATAYKATLPLVIGGVVSATEADLTRAKRLRKVRSLENDVRKALLADPFFGATVTTSLLGKCRRYADLDRPFAFFELDMKVVYHFEKGSL